MTVALDLAVFRSLVMEQTTLVAFDCCLVALGVCYSMLYFVAVPRASLAYSDMQLEAAYFRKLADLESVALVVVAVLLLLLHSRYSTINRPFDSANSACQTFDKLKFMKNSEKSRIKYYIWWKWIAIVVRLLWRCLKVLTW